jgi:hypothetical protein
MEEIKTLQTKVSGMDLFIQLPEKKIAVVSGTAEAALKVRMKWNKE